MDEPNVSFSPYLLNKLEEIKFIKSIEATCTEEQTRLTKAFVSAFTKRGVPMKTILDALLEMSSEFLKGE